MKHDIPTETLNSNIEFCINEYVRSYKHREMLRDKWFGDMSLEQIAEKHRISTTAVKDVIYGKGDIILDKASRIKKIIIIEE